MKGGDNKLKSKRIITAGIIAAFGLAIMTSSTVFAQSERSGEGMETIVQKIAQKFNLKESEVQAVFEAERTARQAEMSSKFTGRLTTLVTEGKITEAQKQLILTKHKEMQANRPSSKAAKEARRAELEVWANANDIDIQYLMLFGGRGHGFGPKLGNSN